MGFPGSSAGKESACNAGDASSIPGSGKSPGEEIGYPLTGVSFLGFPGGFLGFPGGSDSKESTCNAGDLGSIPGLGRSPGGGMATQSTILAWRIPMDRGAWQTTIHGVAESNLMEQLRTAQRNILLNWN